tara:strand:+ start:487 stop:696 length:210 start_codon:yes stop_codon:yes gene_type:complete
MCHKDKRSCRIERKKQDQNINQQEPKYKPEKKWKNLYMRSIKLERARQLGIDYPRKNSSQLTREAKENL